MLEAILLLGLARDPALATPPLPAQLSLLSQHRSAKDSKVRLFTDFMVARIREEIRRAGDQL